MSLNIKTSAGKAEKLNIAQRVAAIFGLAGLVLAWALVLLPCLIWLLFSLVAKRWGPPSPLRSEA